MPTTAVLELHLPTDIVAAVRTYQGLSGSGAVDEERLRVPLAIGLFAERAISLAKAARLAGLTRREFAMLLKKRGLSAYTYSDREYREDLAFVAALQE